MCKLILLRIKLIVNLLPDVMELQKVAFLPVANGTRLVTASALFVHLMINLSPFAFELKSSEDFVNFMSIYKKYFDILMKQSEK